MQAGTAAVSDINEAYKVYSASSSAEALEEVIACGEGLVRYFARIYGGGCSSDDLYQSGMVGLMRAVKSYDGSTLFSTWASNCIAGEIRHYVRKESAHTVSEQPQQPCEMDADCETHADGAAAHEPMKSFHLRVEDRVLLEQAIKKLSELERFVINALFYRGLTQQQAANELGVSQRSVSRTLKRGLSSLAKLIEGPNFKLLDSSKSFKKV